MLPSLGNWIEYQLKATLTSGCRVVIQHEDVDVSLVSHEHARMLGHGFTPDSLAVMDAVFVIMNKASDGKYKNVWAKGSIVLTDPTGRVVEVMESKP